MSGSSGFLALVGGAEWSDGCDFDRDLLAASGADQVVIVPTAAAYEHPDALVERAIPWFASLGAQVQPVMALDRAGANDPAHTATVRDASFVYLPGPSAMHLRSVLMHSTLWDALVGAWQSGAVVAGSSAGAMALCDPMVDPRGGAFTVGLGMLSQLALIPHADTWSEDKLHRTLKLAPPGLPVVGVDERTAVLRGRDGSWRVAGAGSARVWVDGQQTGLEVLTTLR
jgi:cyanophycinase